MKKINTLYKVIKGKSKQIGDFVPIQLIGGTVNVIVYGGECDDIRQEDIQLSDLANLAPDDSPFIMAGIETFVTVPQYICVYGTATGFQISNVELQEIKEMGD